ncbi:zinc finger protein 383-like [Protopterus annectens]|uniref:zinc finger protein 383-like n=1 Tax=Protopterus annectens TaxID=7888 RepID=UPI001CFAAB41|nr:zinc finger protein 383-like [Protopterus annectens]
MCQIPQGPKLEPTSEEKDCREKENMQYLCATNGRTEQCCGEHRRRLELFCQEDEAFVCVLCVPRHSCHSFVLLNEAVSVYKDKIQVSLSVLESKPNDLRNLVNKKEKELGDLQEDACSLEQYITQEFAKLHQFLHEKEQKLIQLLKDEEAEIQRQMERNLESLRNDVVATHVAVSDASLELRKKVIETLEEKEESTLGLKKVIETLEEKEESTLSLKTSVMATLEAESKGMSELINQKTTGFLTAPETFEDVAVTFSEEEWKILSKQEKELHKEVMVQNYESLVSVGYKIPPEKLLLLIKQDSDEQPKCDVEGKHITKQQGNQEGGFSSIESMEWSVSSILRPSLGQPQIHHSAENLQQCAEFGKHHVMPAPQLHSGHYCSQSCECGTNHSVYTGKKLYTGAEYTKLFSRSCNLIHGQTIYEGDPSLGVQSYGDMKVPKHVNKLKRGKHCKRAESSKCFSQSIHLIHHQTIPSGKKTYVCMECGKGFKRNLHLKQHQNTHREETPYKCAECSKYFTCLSNLQRHCIIHTGKKLYTCMECGKCFTQKGVLKRHQNTHRGEKPYKCEKCSKCFTRLSSLQRHNIIHSDKKPYNCTECSKCFIRKGQLTIHQFSHSGEKPYKCVECNKSFTLKMSLKCHQNLHSLEKPYKCAECNKYFARLGNLQQHCVIHTSKKPYTCMECGKCFRRNEHLKRHQNKHRGETPYKCDECSKYFICRSSLQQHCIIHTGEKPYTCMECGKGFTRNAHLKRHQNTH